MSNLTIKRKNIVIAKFFGWSDGSSLTTEGFTNIYKPNGALAASYKTDSIETFWTSVIPNYFANAEELIFAETALKVNGKYARYKQILSTLLPNRDSGPLVNPPNELPKYRGQALYLIATS